MMNDNSVTEKVEELTTTWNSKVSADHCLHHFGSLVGRDLGLTGYYLTDEDTTFFFSADRSSERSILEIQSDSGYAGAPNLSEGGQDSDSMSESEFWDLTSEIYHDYAEVIKGEGEKGHRYLLEVERSLQDRADRLAKSINNRFRTKIPDGRSNLVVDALRQLNLISEARDQYGAETELKSIVDADLVHQTWSIFIDLAEEDVDGKGVASHYPYIRSQLFTQKWRPCVQVEEFIEGYSCEFNYFPADAPLEALRALSEAYLLELEEEAREMARTFRLLEIRLLLLREILQEYELYGELRGSSEQRVGEIFDEVESSSAASSMGRPPKISEEEDPEDREKVLIEHLQKRENWHKQGRHKGKPKWKQIRLKIEDSDDVSLFRGNEESYGNDGRITVHPERLQQIVEDVEIDLEKTRKELSIPPPD